jgi:flavin-dependent dehydrogenase
MNYATEAPSLPRPANRTATAHRRRVDVIVIGGGPAGCSAAIALSRAGFAVTILERSRSETARIGETLPPEARQWLTALGVWEKFRADGHLESPGIVSAWGGPDLYENDFIGNPNGPGWHVDRRRFDLMLVRVTEESGVEVLRGVRRISINHAARYRASADFALAVGLSAVWHVGALVDGKPLERQGTILIDATGRSSSVACRFGGRRIVYDRLVGLVGLVSQGSTPTSADRRTVVESVGCGWWYTAPLPDGTRVATFLTDADLVRVGRGAREQLWTRQIQQAAYTMDTLGTEMPERGLRVVCARSARLDGMGKPKLLAVGDAVASFDPLSSQGVTWALESGMAAARAIDATLRGDRHAIDDYLRWVKTEFAGYMVLRSEYYRGERRWPDSSFWARRHTELIARDIS